MSQFVTLNRIMTVSYTHLCDSYDMVRQVQGASNFFVGEYMPEYSWAEVTLSNLIRDYFEEGES